MSITGIIFAALIVGGVGLFIGVFLGVAGQKFAVEVDERETKVCDALPGNNCGGCGYAGCSGLAAAIVKGEAEISACPVGGAPVAEKNRRDYGSCSRRTEADDCVCQMCGDLWESKAGLCVHGNRGLRDDGAYAEWWSKIL